MGEGRITDYIVLARKYRSRTFAELIGQEALVRTLSNAIAANKIHHAYVLTGIRGTGKTSTARLLAMALNCENGPSTTWAEDDKQVAQIRAGLHPDVLEFDAASNRGVEDVEKLFEGVAYAPVVGRTKVYIIDEVHMLSTTAFNALLKTLEEPPPAVKFIFATTEVNKIPVTVLSRCQRFDLRRIPVEVLEAHFTAILAKENLSAEPAAVRLIATAADGSVRDGLSLLDQAIALSHGQPVNVATVTDMLGLADKVQVFALLGHILRNETADALALLDGLYAGGQDAALCVQALLEAVHLLTRILLVPSLTEGAGLSEIERVHGVPLAAGSSLSALNRVYQVLFQAFGEVKDAPRPYEALTMAVVRAMHIGQLPPLEALVGQAQRVVAQPAAATIPAPVPVSEARSIGAMAAAPAAPEWPATWEGVVKMLSAKSPGLAATLVQQVRCVRLNPPELEIFVERGLHEANEVQRDMRNTLRSLGLTAEVKLAAAEAVDSAAAPTLREASVQEAAARKEAMAEDADMKDILALFPGAEIETVEMEGDLL